MNISKFKRHVFVILICLWALYERFVVYAGRVLDGDEMNQLRDMSGPLKPFWQSLYNFGDNTTFPGNYILNFVFVQMFGANKWGLVIPAVISTVLGFYLLYLVCSKYFQSTVSFVIVFLIVCFNQTLIYHSFQFRPYAHLPTLALASVYLSDKVISEWDHFSTGSKVWTGVFYFCLVLFHAYGIIMFLIPVAYYLAVNKVIAVRKIHFSKILGYFCIICLLVFPVFFIHGSVNHFGLKFVNSEPAMATIVSPSRLHDTFQFIPNPVLDGRGFLSAIFGNLMGGVKPLYVLLLGMVSALMVPNKDRNIQLGFILLIIIVPIALLLLVDVRSHYWFIQRQWIWTMPLFAFYIGWCWDSTFLFMKNKLAPVKT